MKRAYSVEVMVRFFYTKEIEADSARHAHEIASKEIKAMLPPPESPWHETGYDISVNHVEDAPKTKRKKLLR